MAILWAEIGNPVSAQSLLLNPEYSPASIVSAAGGRPGRIAPNAIVSIYGSHLSLSLWGISPQELTSGMLPTSTPGGDVQVRVNGTRVPLFYVSPQQINALIPPDVLPGVREIQVYRGTVRGPAVNVRMENEAPELFRIAPTFVAATHTDGRVVSPEEPAEEGEVIVIYGTGFGPLRVVEHGVLVPTRASEVARARDYRVRLDGEELPVQSILYVGVTPGFAGLYQLNLRVPTPLGSNPRIEIGLSGVWSAEDLRIQTRKSATPEGLTALHP